MEIFTLIILKLIPLYGFILLGFIIGRKLKPDLESIAKVVIYGIIPLVILHGTATAPLNVGVLILPIVIFCIAGLIAIVALHIGRRLWSDVTANLFGFAAGNGNTGYFGLPLAIALFPESTVSIMIMAILGMVLYENTVGFYITARGHHTASEAFGKVIRLPTVYAFIVGLILNLINIPIGQAVTDVAMQVRGAYTVIGMMIIGLGLAKITHLAKDGKFVLSTLLAKFVVWPAVAAAVIFLDRHTVQLFSEEVYAVLTLISIVPMAANTVSYAEALRTHPEKAALAVFVSTLVALLVIPVMVYTTGI
ncbi:MAG TPA: transporter [Candidatus Kerfeldbacteria bacterium]|nr:transporter [Candidatus Kerfeldbacteria bacterium]